MQWFRDWSLFRKLLMLTCVGSALTLAVGGAGYWGMKRVSGDTAALLRGAVTIADHAAGAEIEVLQIRRQEKNLFMRIGNAKEMADSETKMDKNYGRLKEHLKALQQVVELSGDRERMTQLGAALDGYAEGMRGVIAKIKSGEITNTQDADKAILPFREVARQLDAVAEKFAEDARARVPIAEDRLAANTRRASLIMALFAATAVVVGVFLSLQLARLIARPLRDAVMVLEELAQGEGDLGVRLDVRSKDEIGALAVAFNTFVDKLHDMCASVRMMATQTAAAARQLADGSQQLASGTQEQASALEQTAASLEQMSGTVTQNADNARQASQVASGAKTAAESGGAVVTEAVTAMEAISGASRQIAAIITTIDEIAFQTNLLALNAAVEAARAGEQGRGFAVVAAEVRALAQRSAAASKEIKSLITNTVGKVSAGSTQVTQAGQTLTEIVGQVKAVANLVAEIAAASQEQAQGIEQVNKAVSQMDGVTQQYAAQTEELSSTAQSLTGQASELLEQVGRFKLCDNADATLPMSTPQACGIGNKVVPLVRKTQSPMPAVAHAKTGTDGGEFQAF